jgi:hypothetical protein
MCCRRSQSRLQHIHDELPESPDREAMWAHEVPRDVATEVYGVIDSDAPVRKGGV